MTSLKAEIDKSYVAWKESHTTPESALRVPVAPLQYLPATPLLPARDLLDLPALAVATIQPLRLLRSDLAALVAHPLPCLMRISKSTQQERVTASAGELATQLTSGVSSVRNPLKHDMNEYIVTKSLK